MNIEQQIVGQWEIASGCTSTVVLPPPDACPPIIHQLYGIAEWHPISSFIVFVFIACLLYATYLAFVSPAGGGH